MRTARPVRFPVAVRPTTPDRLENTVGIFYNHHCRVCGLAYPNYRMRRSGWRKWICDVCARERGLAKRGRR